LIRALASGEPFDVTAHDRLTGVRQRRGSHDEVHVAASDDPQPGTVGRAH